MTRKKRSSVGKRLRIKIDRKDFTRALNLLILDTNIGVLALDHEKCEIYYIEPRDAYEKAKKVSKDNNIKFFVEE